MNWKLFVVAVYFLISISFVYGQAGKIQTNQEIKAFANQNRNLLGSNFVRRTGEYQSRWGAGRYELEYENEKWLNQGEWRREAEITFVENGKIDSKRYETVYLNMADAVKKFIRLKEGLIAIYGNPVETNGVESGLHVEGVEWVFEDFGVHIIIPNMRNVYYIDMSFYLRNKY